MRMPTNDRVRSRTRRHRRVRKKVVGTPDRPRLAVFRSNKHIYAQVIDDVAGRTLASSSTIVTSKGDDPLAKAKSVGLELASRAKDAGVSTVAFDRGGFMYHGRVKALADGAREGGLEF
jgi:large subunit ribosomal protein L18